MDQLGRHLTDSRKINETVYQNPSKKLKLC